jgi:tRNA dimethylallyltransferase
MSSFHKRLNTTDIAINNIASKAVNTLPKDQFNTKNLLFISLEPNDRVWLHQRIAQRFDVMLQDGFEQEVRDLRARGDLQLDTPSIRCVGYRQMWEALDAVQNAELDKKTSFELREKGIAATRQLCKRQLTWLRSMPQRQVVACDSENALAQILTSVDSWL